MMKVQDIMTKDVAFISPSTNAAAAAEIMWNNNCGALPVVDEGGRVVGIVTDRDLFIALATRHRQACDLTVGEVTSGQNLSVCATGDDVRTALATMGQRQIKRLPVVDKAGALKGIVSIDDIALSTQTGDIAGEDVLATLRAIWSRQTRAAAAQVQSSGARTIAA